MPPTTRIRSIDFLRGLVMIIMALDHTRDLFHVSAFTLDPLDLQATTPFLFFTRWITHFCAPVFVFLSGTSAFLQSLRKPSRQLRWFLFTRGLWLIVAELLIITLGISFDIYYHMLIFQVIWAIGISMVFLSLIIRLPFPVVLALGLIIICGHNLLDFLEVPAQTAPVWLQGVHQQAFIAVTNKLTLVFFYPFLPWVGIMVLGYCFGKVYTLEPHARKKIILRMGLGCIAAFILLRLFDGYGDSRPWSVQPSLLYTVMSFVNTQKYPPSLLYFLMTIGPALIVLAWSENLHNRFSSFAMVYGNVPFFYYIAHFYLIHLVSAILFLLRGHSVERGMEGSPNLPFKFLIPGEGYSLGIVYLVWILIVLFLYPLCRAYGQYKRNHHYAWLSYL